MFTLDTVYEKYMKLESSLFKYSNSFGNIFPSQTVNKMLQEISKQKNAVNGKVQRPSFIEIQLIDAFLPIWNESIIVVSFYLISVIILLLLQVGSIINIRFSNVFFQVPSVRAYEIVILKILRLT